MAVQLGADIIRATTGAGQGALFLLFKFSFDDESFLFVNPDPADTPTGAFSVAGGRCGHGSLAGKACVSPDEPAWCSVPPRIRAGALPVGASHRALARKTVVAAPPTEPAMPGAGAATSSAEHCPVCGPD